MNLMPNLMKPLGPEEVSPEEERRKMIHAALTKALSPAPDNTQAIAQNESKAQDLTNQSQLIRGGNALGAALLGRLSNGDNPGSQGLDDQAKMILGKNLEMKAGAAEAEKRRADIAKAFGLQDTQDAAQLQRQDKNNQDQIARDNNQNTNTVNRDGAKFGQEEKMAGVNHGYNMELEGLKGQNKVASKSVAGGKTIPGGLVEKIAGYDVALGSVKSLQDYAAAKGIQPGKIKTVVQDFAKNFGAQSPEYARFQAEIGSNVAEYIKAMSGAATSDQERTELNKNIPTTADSPDAFAEKMEWFEGYVARKRNTLVDTLRKSQYDTTGFDGETPTPAPGKAAVPSASNLVRVSNGKEILEIDPSDLAAAEKDGYKRLP